MTKPWVIREHTTKNRILFNLINLKQTCQTVTILSVSLDGRRPTVADLGVWQCKSLLGAVRTYSMI